MSDEKTTIEVKAVNPSAPVVLSDKIIDQVDVIKEQARRIGQLEGEKEVFRNNAKVIELQYKEKEEDLQKKVVVEIRDRTSDTGYVVSRTTCSADSSYTNPYERAISMLTNGSKGIEVITKNIDSLTEMADAVVKGDAKKEVDTANKKVEKAETSAKIAKEVLEASDKAQKDEIERNIERSEKTNIKRIAALNAEIKVKDTKIELHKDELHATKHDLELAIEALDYKNSLLEKQIESLTQGSKNIVKSATARLNYWAMGRKLSRIN